MSLLQRERGEYRRRIEPLQPEALKKVLTVFLGRDCASEDEIEDLTHFILNFFGYGDYLLDNVLKQCEREVFYTFEEMGILKAVQEEVHIHGGKRWRIHFWVFNRELIDAVLRGNFALEEDPFLPESLYSRLNVRAWKRRSPDRAME